MPRLIDKIDAAIGGTPEHLELDVDYLQQRPCPPVLIDADGHYTPGWFDDWTGVLNFQDGYALDIAFHRFFHLTLDTPRHFLVWNIADFQRAGNTALLVCDKATGRFEKSSVQMVFPRNPIRVSPDARHFTDTASRSFIRADEAGSIHFSMHCEHLHLQGVAEPAIGPTFVQCTRYQRGRGSLQWYGALRLRFGTLTVGDDVWNLPEGSLGTMDRTIGHQRGMQNWCWIASAGPARSVETGRDALLALQIARDGPRARPQVASRKHIVWLDGRVTKIPTASFQFTRDEQGASGPWEIRSQPGEDSGFDLHLEPRFHRREQAHGWLVHADFNQHYGPLVGRVRVHGETWELRDHFAVAEDVLLEL